MPSNTPRMSNLALLFAIVCALAVASSALPAGASAAGGFHMSRDFSANGETGRAFGKLCGKSKFGNWRWRASLGSGDLRVNYRWIEPVRRDGKARNLRFTEISGPIVESQPESLRSLFVASVKRVLDRVTVRRVAGGRKLEYETPLGGKSTVRFRPARGC